MRLNRSDLADRVGARTKGWKMKLFFSTDQSIFITENFLLALKNFYGDQVLKAFKLLLNIDGFLNKGLWSKRHEA